MNISFKAKLKGVPEPYIAEIFEYKTKKYPDDVIIYKGKDSALNWDLFILEKENKQIVKYLVPNSHNKKIHNLNDYLKIFNIIKIKEAMIKIEENKQRRLTKKL